MHQILRRLQPLSWLACLAVAAPAWAQIEEGIAVGIRDFAVLPDSAIPGTSTFGPARMNLMTADPLGRLFVNDQHGGLYQISADGSSVTTYLNLQAAGQQLTSNGGERGFSSFAFHPDFAAADPSTPGFGKFYTLHHTTNTAPTPTYPFVSNGQSGFGNAGDSVLLEWTVSDPTASTYAQAAVGLPREVLRLQQPANNHNLGQIAFNPTPGALDDRGNLYIASGDGGNANDPWELAENPNNLYGKLLRINPLDPDGAGGANYSAPTTNFFAADGDASTLPEIYALGLRNPQRFGWDIQDGTLYVADIGQSTREEINVIVNGGNYGWDRKEGSTLREGPDGVDLIDPIAEYNHGSDIPANPNATGSRAITVGEVVRGTSIPGIDGLLLTGDFPSGVPLYLDVSDPTPGSGADPFAELILIDIDGSGEAVELFTLIDDANGPGSLSRADLRWSIGTDGRVFLLNKQDGIIRELVAIPEPTSVIALGGVGLLILSQRRRKH